MPTKKARGDLTQLRIVANFFAAPLGALASIATVMIMIAVTIDVFSRNLGGASVPGILEMSESALVATVFLGLAYTGATNGHVAVDLVTHKLPYGWSRLVAGIVWLTSSVMVLWFIYATFERAMDSTAMGEVQRGLIEWPVWPARWLVVVGYVSFLLIAIINTILAFAGRPLLGEEDDLLIGATEEIYDTPSGSHTGSLSHISGTDDSISDKELKK